VQSSKTILNASAPRSGCPSRRKFSCGSGFHGAIVGTLKRGEGMMTHRVVHKRESDALNADPTRSSLYPSQAMTGGDCP
jgi:hypothetical protein